MMSEHEVWKWLADLWRTAKKEGDYPYWAVDLPRGGGIPLLAHGLCSCINYLEDSERIEFETNYDMALAIAKEKTRLGATSLYIWSRDEAGAAERVAFCERMAEATKPR
jgi:hypothetical protein